MDVPSQEMSLRDYASVVLGRKLVVIAAVVVAIAVAVLSTALQTPVYSASSEVLIQPRGEGGFFEDSFYLDERAIDTEVQVIEGQAVRLRVQDDLGLADLPAPVTASSVGDSQVIALSVRSTNASNARTLANAYANAYVSVRLEQSVGELLAAGTQIENRINDLETEIEALADDDPTRNSLVAQLASFNRTLDELRVDQNLRTGGAIIVKSAELPVSPVEPTPRRTAMLAGVVGLLLGLGAAFLLDYLDDKVRTEDELERVSRKPVLAVVPVDRPPNNLPIAMTEPDHAAVEAYRGLRTNLQFLGLDEPINVLQVTSSLPGEGKTTTAVNLAVVLAQAGQRVALVDADLRRPRVHEVFAIAQSPGFTDLLLGAGAKSTVQHVLIDGSHQLSVFASGTVPSNPSELLSGRRTRKLLAEMGAYYDYVVVDSAPILPVSDSVALSSAVDGMFVVAHAGRVTKGQIEEALERLDRVAAPVLGVILNQATGQRNDAYSYGGYGALPRMAPKEPSESATIDADETDPTTARLFADS
jgi:succinoglycan biosynthesis transport protein ExoP